MNFPMVRKMRSVTIPEANYEYAKLHLQDQVSYDQEMQNNILSVIMGSRSLSPLFWIWAISCVNEHNNKIRGTECLLSTSDFYQQ